MEQAASLTERVKALKSIAASMQHGSFHTQLIPEVDRILALPDELASAAVAEREAVARQVREFEATFDRLGYSLVEQLMPPTSVSHVFRIVQASDEFKTALRRKVGQPVKVGEDGSPRTLEPRDYLALTGTSLSIGTPPVTREVRDLIGRIIFGKDVGELDRTIDVLGHCPTALGLLFDACKELVASSLHYSTAQEETEFLRLAADFNNYEGGRILNRVVITESPERVIDLIENHVFDKIPAGQAGVVRVVDGIDRLDDSLVAAMLEEPHHVFVARITRIPHGLFTSNRGENPWKSVLGRLVLIDSSTRARATNTTIVHTLFPHVVRTLRNVQTSLAGRPANTQLTLRRLLETFGADELASIRDDLGRRLELLEREQVLRAGVTGLRTMAWKRGALFDYLSLVKVRRLVSFVHAISCATEESRAALGLALRERVARNWMRYFYDGLPGSYRSAVLPGGGRGALKLVGEYHRQAVREKLEEFEKRRMARCLDRLDEAKKKLEIPSSSTDEIRAAMKQSRLRSQSPSASALSDDGRRLSPHPATSLLYRAADLVERLARRAERTIERATFGNLTGEPAARIKRRMGTAGFGALHGRLERVVGRAIDRTDRTVRTLMVPLQGLVRGVRRRADGLRGGLDPVSIGEIEAILASIQQGSFHPTLVLPELAWTYEDVFPEKHFPKSFTVRVPLNDHHEMDPEALLARVEALGYLLRDFPEVFELCCTSMLLVINSPHNPTGVVYRQETVLRLLAIAADFDLTVVDDNSYHKLISPELKAREGEACVAQVHEDHRSYFPRPVKLLTVSATTKGLQGSGDRTGLVHSNVPEAVEFCARRASEAHLMSLYLTDLKLEHGLAAKRWTAQLEGLASRALNPLTSGGLRGRFEELLETELASAARDDFPASLFEVLLEGYEDLVRLEHRGAGVPELSSCLSGLVTRVKRLRPERALRADVERRKAAVRAARDRVLPRADEIVPTGAFYYCVRLCADGNDQGVQEFLQALARYRKVDVTYAGRGYVRLSLGGEIDGSDESYAAFEQAVEIYLSIIDRTWTEFVARGRDPRLLPSIFLKSGETLVESALRDLSRLLPADAASRSGPVALPIDPDERGIVYSIEEGRSVTDKVCVEYRPCETVHELLESQPFRVVYRRLLKRVFRGLPALADLTFEQVENQYGPHACFMAYRDRHLIDELFRQLMLRMYDAWHGSHVVKVLSASLEVGNHGEKVAALHGLNRKVNELVNELMHAFAVSDSEIRKNATFDVGFEILRRLEPHPALPGYLARVIENVSFAGATTALNPSPGITTGATARPGDQRYGFLRREADPEGGAAAARPAREYFTARLDQFSRQTRFPDYLAKAVQVGPFKMLLVLHRSYLHLLCDELRLFPQIPEVQLARNLDRMAWDGALLFGVPAAALGDAYRTGYILDRRGDGSVLPVFWVAREDATDYTGFLKKSLLTMHNELVKALGGMPVHGAMITITFKNGLRKTLVFSADSGTGKSETITAMMEQLIAGTGKAAEVRSVDILASDMLSLWRGEDHQLYAFGTETGDFLRLNDTTAGWKAHFGDLLKRGSTSNGDHPRNARVTIPGICAVRDVLTPTRVNGFFYINNYEPPRARAVELSQDPHQILKSTLVRGLRKNKGTSGDQPSLRAGLEYAGKSKLVVRFRHAIDELLDWQPRGLHGSTRTCLCYRDGEGDIRAAEELVAQSFEGESFELSGKTDRIEAVEYDVLRNLFWLRCASGDRRVLDREVYDRIYEPLASTFCGNPFVEPDGMERILDLFARSMLAPEVHRGVIRTQLARPGLEFAGPARAAQDIISFLLEDETVNARFQRNKRKVYQAMQSHYPGILGAGDNLPVDLEGYNLLLLEAHESTHVCFLDPDGKTFTLSTPFYRFDPARGAPGRTFTPAIATPETLAVIRDLCSDVGFSRDFRELDVDLAAYDRISHFNGIEELTCQVLLLHGVFPLGASDTEVARFPLEVRKARHVAELITRARSGPPAS